MMIKALYRYVSEYALLNCELKGFSTQTGHQL